MQHITSYLIKKMFHLHPQQEMTWYGILIVPNVKMSLNVSLTALSMICISVRIPTKDSNRLLEESLTHLGNGGLHPCGEDGNYAF